MSLSAANMALLFTASGALLASNQVQACHDVFNYQASKLSSSDTVDFCQAFEGKAVLVVNTASQCGYTPQFADLEKLHKEYGDKLAVVGFPSDDFNQEYADADKIANVCRVNYGVTFTMLEPSKVKGEDANPLFKQLADRTGKEPSWNFNKYLISADGETVVHFASGVSPASADFRSELEAVLK